MSSSYDFSDEEFDLQEEEDVAMILAMHINKKPKHGGSVLVVGNCGGKGSMPTTD
jgi:hypothetical protein